ncbi:hypothetical protein ES703_90861 [subsurface metagenome]
MIELRPVETVERIKPAVKVVLPNWWLKFSDAFPSSLDHVRGKTFSILKQQQVKYELSWIIEEACYKDVNLSNEDAGEKLYPDVADNLYEVIIGFKPGNYFCHVYFPAEYPLYRLDYPDMSPNISDASLKYLGAIRPEDSPVDNPIFKLYLVFRLKPIILRLYADDGIDYEKIGLELTVNRCLMQEGVPPPEVKPKPIQYLDEIKWLSLGAGGA